MKIVLLIALLVFLFSCSNPNSSNDDGHSEVQIPYVGIWIGETNSCDYGSADISINKVNSKQMATYLNLDYQEGIGIINTVEIANTNGIFEIKGNSFNFSTTYKTYDFTITGTFGENSVGEEIIRGTFIIDTYHGTYFMLKRKLQ